MADNTGSNLGTGHVVFSSKVGDDLQFKTLIAGTNITLANSATEITITASNDTTAINLGTGSGIFTSKSGDNIQLKSLIANAASGISLTSNANDLTLQLVSANVDAGKLGGVVASDFLRKSNNLSGLTNVATARTNLSVYSKAEIDANVVRNNANVLPSLDNNWSLGNNSYRWSAIYANRFYGLASVAGSINELSDIGNVDLTGKVNNDIIKYNASTSNWETGKLSLLTLSDTPANYTGAANKYLKVNSSGNGVEFVTGIATESYVTSQINALVGGAPGALDTLNELAEALNDNADFHTTITNNLAGKENTITPGTTAQYYRGDKTFQTLNSDVVPEGSTNKYVSSANMASISIDALSDVRTTGSNAPSDAQALIWDNVGGYWKPGTVSGGGGGGGSGDITAVIAGTGLTGGASSGAATINADVGTTANKLVQLNGSAQLPAVSGALLTNINTDNLTEGSSKLFYTEARFDTRFGTKSTTNLSEGTNLYYTDARVNTRVNALGKANWDSAYGWGDHGAAGYQTTAGLNGAIDAHLNQSNPTAGYVLSWNGSDYAWVDNGAGAGDITRVNITAGTGLTGTQDTASGEHTQTLAVDVGTTANKIVQLDGSARLPAVDGSQLTGVTASIGADSINDTHIDFGTGANQVSTADVPEQTNLYFTNARADARIVAAGSANWNTAYGWGDHGAAGYQTTAGLNGAIDTHLNQSNPTAGYVLSWNGSDYAWVSNGTGGLTDLVNDTSPQLGGTLDANGNTIDMGTNVITDAKVGQWDTAFGWGNHASAGYLSSETFTSLVQDTTPQLGGNLDVQTSTIKSSGNNVQLGEGISATGFTGTLASRINGLAAYFTRTSDNSKRHYSTGWNNTQTLSTNIDAANKKQGWHTDSTLKLDGYTHGTNDANDVSKLFGDYSYTNLTSSGNTTANGVVGHHFQAEVRDDSAGTINTSHIIGIRARAGNYKAGSTATNAYGLYVDTAKDGAATITNRYSIYAPQSSDKAYFAGPVQVGAWTLPIADGSAGQVLKTDGSGNVTWGSDTGHTNTDTLTEGSSNLYFTNARADARIAAASINALSDVNTSGVATNKILKYNGTAWVVADDTDTVYTTFNSDFDTRLSAKDTGDLSEGSNLYYTQARADARVDAGFSAKSTTNLSEGTNLYYTDARADARITAALIDEDNMASNSATRLPSQQSVKAYVDSQILTKDNTDEITEGSTNLYYTDARVDARITGNWLLDEDNMASNSATKFPSQQSVKAYVDSQVASENEISEMNDVTITSVQNNQFLKYNSASSRWVNASVTPATAAGSDTQVQFNDGGTIGADSDFTYNKTTNKITVGSVTTTGASPAISSSGALGISTTASNSDITITPHGTGDIILDGQKWPQADGSANQYLKTNGSGQLSWDSLTTDDVTEGANLYFTNARADARFDVKIGAADTGDLSEGSNLYYTDARADARITNALIDEDNMASNSATKLPSQQSVKAYVDAQVAGKDNTDEITEGSTNLYFTNARAISAVQGTNIDMGSNNITTTGKILYSNVYSQTSDLPSASTYHGMFAHVHGTGKGYFAHGGNWVALANESALSSYQTTAGLNAAIDAHLNQSNPTSGYVLSWNGSDYAWVTNAGYTNTDFDNRLATKDTDDVTEGSTNLYFTNARADTRATLRIGAADLSALNNVHNAAPTDGQVLTWDNGNSRWAPATPSSGGSSTLTGLTDTTISGPSSGQVLKYNGSAWVNAADAGGIALTDLSVGAEGSASGNGAIAYNSGNGTFTYTPPVLSGLTGDTDDISEGSSNLYFTNARADARIGAADLADLSNVHTAAPTNGQVLTWDNGNSRWAPATPSGGSGSTVVERFKINYATNGQLSSITDKTSGISSVSIDSASGGDITINTTGYSYPPANIIYYGYQYASNKYNVLNMNKDVTLREVPGGGSSGSPTAFGSFSSIKVKAAEADTGAGRSFGTVTHAWVQLVMGG